MIRTDYLCVLVLNNHLVKEQSFTIVFMRNILKRKVFICYAFSFFLKKKKEKEINMHTHMVFNVHLSIFLLFFLFLFI